MNQLKKILGIVWMIVGPVIIFLLVKNAIQHIDLNGKADINKPIPWIIIIAVFTPIAIGFMIFGWYAFKGEYNREASGVNGQ